MMHPHNKLERIQLGEKKKKRQPRAIWKRLRKEELTVQETDNELREAGVL